MHLTLHLTARCNMRCRYCYAAPHVGCDMTWEIARSAVDVAVRLSGRETPNQGTGIIFFGGEPLLRRDLIKRTVEYCGEVSARTGRSFHFKLTTNGSLLDDAFFDDPSTSEVFVALSHDGIPEAHDANRITPQGTGTFSALRPKIDLLLSRRPYAPVMMVTTPSTVRHYAESVKFLFKCGFRYLISSLNYGSVWGPGELRELKRQVYRLARWYEGCTDREEKFYFSPFDVKMASHVFPGSCRRDRCELGRRQISVAPTGRLFPCVQFVGDGSESEYCIGDVETGIDEGRRQSLYFANAEEKRECAGCAIRERCNHFCACLNRQATGSIRRVSPLLCAYERMVLEAADKIGERLFRKRSAMFIQKQYNELFPLISLAEDQTLAQSMCER
ncbi:MAG TPA: radical SAM protein [Acidobacteriota bacterium]|nr:radical SAM protein [Acidobacteriota bacterium]